jgi:hypothetical protein
VPADRLLHPRLGHSDKVSGLSDLEYRVWTVYLFTADDFGVMRASAVTLQAADDSLLGRPTKTIQRALERLIAVGLLSAFDDQGRRYVCQLNWQSWQHVQYPRETLNPRPPEGALAEMDEPTQLLFSVWNANSKAPKPRKCSGSIPENSRTEQESIGNIPDLACAHTRETANGIRQTLPANATGKEDTFAEFWKRYPRREGKGAARRAWEKLRPSADLVRVILAAVDRQRASSQWIKESGRFIPHPSTWLNQERWQDEPSDMPGISERSAAALAMLQEDVVYDT